MSPCSVGVRNGLCCAQEGEWAQESEPQAMPQITAAFLPHLWGSNSRSEGAARVNVCWRQQGRTELQRIGDFFHFELTV